MEHVLAVTDSGDHKPSALVNYLLSTLSEYGPEVLLQHVILRTLPAHVEDALTTSGCTDLESLGDPVDLIMARPRCQTLPVCSVLNPQGSP